MDAALTVLIERVRKAGGPDLLIDEAIARLLGWSHRVLGDGALMHAWFDPDGKRRDFQSFTARVDAALPNEADGYWDISGPRKYLSIPTVVPNRWRAAFRFGPELHTREVVAWGATEPLARRLAGLMAKVQQ